MAKVKEAIHSALHPIFNWFAGKPPKPEFTPPPPPPMMSLNRIVTVMVRRPGRIKEHRVMSRKMSWQRLQMFTKTPLMAGEKLKCRMLLNRGLAIEFDAYVGELKNVDDFVTGEFVLNMGEAEKLELDKYLHQSSVYQM